MIFTIASAMITLKIGMDFSEKSNSFFAMHSLRVCGDFLSNRKLRSLFDKKLRKDRTAAEWKMSLCDPPQAENPAKQDSFLF